MFDSDDLASWIVRAKVYFQVQGTYLDVKVNLSQFCMDWSKIHFFKSLLTLEQHKVELLERYGLGTNKMDKKHSVFNLHCCAFYLCVCVYI